MSAFGKVTSGILFGTIVAMSGVALASGSGGGASGPKAHWGYSGEEGPTFWGNLSTAYTLCSTGHMQSPIDIKHTQQAGLAPIDVSYQATPLNIVNNGHTIQVNYAKGSKMTIGNTSYNLLQFHFHSPSENIVAGKPFPMEAHFVHADDHGTLGVLGVFMTVGKENTALGEIWNHLPKEVNKPVAMKQVVVNGRDLLPENKNYYRFVGSLTTPPCSEGVQWHVLKTPIEVSSGQVKAFLDLVGENARPVQQLGHRLLIDSSNTGSGASH
jgi:carbonic anhydrase